MYEQIGAGSDRAAIPVHLENGAVVYIDASIASSRIPAEEIVSGKALSFNSAVAAIKGTCDELASAIKSVAPERFTVEMGFDFAVGTAGLSAAFVKGDATASVKVTMEWEQSDKT